MTHGARVWIALGTVYVLWGSTYLGIELVGETIPPLFGVGVRFLAAASLSAAQGRQTFIGTITDNDCDTAVHSRMRMGPTDAECALACMPPH